jgi:hypothetical protein
VGAVAEIRAEEPLWLTALLCVAIALLGALLIRFRHALVQFSGRDRFSQWLFRLSPTYERFSRAGAHVMIWVVGVGWIAGGLFGLILVMFGPFG